MLTLLLAMVGGAAQRVASVLAVQVLQDEVDVCHGESGAYAGIAIARAGTVMPLSTLECGGAYACHSNAPLAVGSELGRVTVSSLSWVQHK
jgi:hypothetical protein